ncbi:TetR/AcrR family transcriptional regulator [Solimonas soli]|uniref:TetR/AcrR family transcriptional regulator n=1 Tax=Solimonas soli TaxID=413479 RepID=UPI0004846EC6|nr:TetR/AcrR family transcriptional regulator [Solimonas soli]
MGIRERRQREVAGREQRFLGAARDLIRQDGLLNLQMSKVAEKCDYAVGTLYQHFVSKEDLLVALATDEAQERVDMFQRVHDWRASTRERMIGFAVADMLYARRNPGHFRLFQFALTEVVWGAAPASRRQACLDANAPLRQLTLALIDEAVRKGDLDLRGLRPDEVCLAPWAMAFGMHSIMHTEGLLEHHEVREPYHLMLRHLSELLNGLGWKPLADPMNHAAFDALAERICKEVLHEYVC